MHRREISALRLPNLVLYAYGLFEKHFRGGDSGGSPRTVVTSWSTKSGKDTCLEAMEQLCTACRM